MLGTRARSLALAMLLLLGTMTVTPAVSAVGPNQNDMGMTSGDLPDNLSSPTSVPNLIFSGSVTGSGELVSGTDDTDLLRVALNSNEGLAAELSFASGDDFDLEILDTNQNSMAYSYFSNPEAVSTNSSFSNHGGMVYIAITAYSFAGTSGAWNLTVWKFTTGSSGGGGGSGNSSGGAPPNPCTGNGTTTSDILEPNDSVATATLASTLPLDCTGLSIHSTVDEDIFEVNMVAGVTYYVNVTFQHFNGDIDTGWETATGGYLSGSGSTSNIESMTVSATLTQATYVRVYGYSGAINTYDIEITTDQPGGGGSFTSVVPTVVNATTTDLVFSGLTNGSAYSVDLFLDQQLMNGTVLTTSLGGLNHTANGTGHNATMTHIAAAISMESDVCIVAELYDANGTFVSSGQDCYFFEVLVVEATSSTTGDIEATNLTLNTPMSLWWFVYDLTAFDNAIMSNGFDVEAALNASIVNETVVNFTTASTSMSWQVNWTGVTNTNTHGLIGLLWVQGATTNITTFEGFSGLHGWNFVPQLPSLIITSVTKSTSAATNDVRTEGLDLVTGDGYHYQVRLTDGAGATLQNSTMTSFTATAQNMSLPAWSFVTPNGSGTYCAAVDLYTNTMVQMIGDSDCFTLTFDNDGDGIANEYDLCPNTPLGATVDMDGCALSQKDTDSDGYNDSVDMFPNNPDQHWDTDGDGYGDNSAGNGGDAYPADASQWADSDGDGYGDNPSGTNGDAFPLDSTQWADSDGDGYGDNPNGNNPDLWPNDSSQWADSDGDGYGDNPTGTQGDAFPNDATQWQDSDGDGYGDNPAGNDADLWPNDNTQWKDDDGDGYGDNPSGTDGDAFPSDGTQWKDRDGDGYGDNAAGNNPDAFPDDGTQWVDRDGDGYGDNAAGTSADAFPDDATQWADRDGDGYGDNINGNSPDHCPDTPQGEAVDEKGCATVELDEDNDGVTDDLDVCPQTNATMSVDGFGCAEDQKDGDLDGVVNLYDACPDTPPGRTVDAAGCAAVELDTDNDGINDARDQCPTTTPGMSVDGEGCAANERDADMDGVSDADDLCDYTDAGEAVDDQGCAANQRDTDNDGVTDAADVCSGTLAGSTVDGVGCADYQLDADGDMISDSVDQCDATPAGEAVDQVGCSDSQKDEDGDGRSDAVDLCPDTPAGIVPDIFGCVPSQLDTDMDGVDDGNDRCPMTNSTAVVNADGCALYQLDTDNDGVTDDLDAFPDNATADSDRDGDGVADQFDAYPDDGLRSTLEPERNSTGLILGVVALLAIAGLAALLVVRREGATVATGLGSTAEVDAMAEATFAAEDKALPELQSNTGAATWEENGVHWNRDAQGNLTYWDATSETWVPYNG